MGSLTGEVLSKYAFARQLVRAETWYVLGSDWNRVHVILLQNELGSSELHSEQS